VIGVQCAGSEGSGSHDSGFLDNGRWQLSIGVRKQRSHRHFVGTVEQKQRAEQGTEVVNNIYLYDVALTYAVNKRFNLTVGVPIQRATRRRGTSPQIFHSTGIGDVIVMGRMWLWKPPTESGQNISFGIGLKLPTGRSDVKDTVPAANGKGTVTQVVDQSIQLGDGGWGIPLDVQAYKRFGSTTLYASGTYLLNPRDTNGVPTGRGRPSEAIMSVADQYLARVGVSRPIPKTRQWAFTVGWRIEGVPVRDLIGKSNGFRRPGYGMAIEPGVQYFRARDTWSVTVPIAAGRNRKRSVSDILVGNPGGDAAFADYMILAGYSHRF
jgi:Putative MetA-pathway of phenol degradation